MEYLNYEKTWTLTTFGNFDPSPIANQYSWLKNFYYVLLIFHNYRKFSHSPQELISSNQFNELYSISDGLRSKETAKILRRDDLKRLLLSMSSLHGSGSFNALLLSHCVSEWICITFDLIVLLCFFTTILVRSFNQSFVECGYCKLIRTVINEMRAKSSEKHKIK